MQTLSYGYKKPQTGDQGSTLFTALSDNIQRVNDHDHDGSDSALLTAASVTSVTQSIAAGSWVATSQGNYRQLVTLPGSLDYDNINIIMKNSSGHVVFATIEKVSDTTYYVYTNDVSTGYTAVYSS
jgi:hypothetical protein